MATTTQTPFPTSPASPSSSTSSSPGSSSGSSLGGTGSPGSTSSGSAASLSGGSTSSGAGSSGAGSSGSMGGSADSMDSSYGTSGRGSDNGMGRNERMERVVQGAHQAVDTLAAKAAPLVERFSSSVDGASDQMHDRADQLSAMQEEWVESARTTVREHPLASLAAAVAVGMLISRLSR